MSYWSRSNADLVSDKGVVGFAVLVVRELCGSGRRLGLRVFDASFHVVEGGLEHLPFDVDGDGVPERGKRTHVRRWGGQSGGYRGAGALVPGAVESGMGGRVEKKWGGVCCQR